MSPLVSIIIPCFNSGAWIEETLESALCQTHRNCEVIVVDDGSSDQSANIIERYLTRGVRLIRQKNAGASAARNTGFRHSRGLWIQFLDADDLLAPDKIERQLQRALATQGEYAWCCLWSRFVRTTSDADFTPQPLCCDADPVDWMIMKLEQNRMMHPAAWLIPRSLANRAGLWNESLTLDDDGEYFSRVVLASRGVRCCMDTASFYRSQIRGSLSDRKSDEALHSAFTSARLSTERLLARENSSRTRRAVAIVLQRFIYEAYPAAPESRRAAEALVSEYGGCDLRPEGGPSFTRVSRVLGWRLAKLLQRGLRR